MKNISALLLTVLLAAASRGAAAQEAPGDAIGDLPPALGMPGEERNDLPLGEGTEAEGEPVLAPVPEGEEIAPGVVGEDGESILGEPHFKVDSRIVLIHLCGQPRQQRSRLDQYQSTGD